eukprot:TRINITY_DN5373_c0_g1_i1.p2 TRINITY_DN5373_c0_g1~~TRINITY_DN5373_c0_g1_i1.p2  ORF type:complete len:191 (+),score=-18.03 TRINITY_DN5373_c0_g1_i1:272-844(+)
MGWKNARVTEFHNNNLTIFIISQETQQICFPEIRTEGYQLNLCPNLGQKLQTAELQNIELINKYRISKYSIRNVTFNVIVQISILNVIFNVIVQLSILNFYLTMATNQHSQDYYCTIIYIMYFLIPKIYKKQKQCHFYNRLLASQSNRKNMHLKLLVANSYQHNPSYFYQIMKTNKQLIAFQKAKNLKPK